MNTKATKAKQTKKEATKSFTLQNKHKTLILLALATTGVVSVIGLLKLTADTEFTQTQIKTPVIARTELSKKPTIEIKVFDGKNQDTVINETAVETKEVIEEDKAVTEVISTVKTDDLTAIVKNLTAVELAQAELKTEIATLKSATNAESIKVLNTKVAKLESLNGNIGNMSKIFLAQQLVLLDNAFKVGGNQNLAIENIHNFAKNVAKDEKVAAKLQDLLNLTKQQAIITPQALLFYAKKLEGLDLISLEDNKKELPADASFVEKVKNILQSFIIIRKQTEVSAEQELWLNSVESLQEAIIFTDFVTVEEILADEKLQQLGDEDFANFAKLFNTYLTQQQALQATLGAFIEGYNYDY